MSVLTVAFDSDGVIDTFGDGVYETMVARGIGHLWKSGPTPHAIWNFYEEWKNEDGTPWTFEQFKELVDWGVDHGYVFSGHFREGAVEAVGRIHKMGHRVIIITDRAWGSDPRNSQRNTIEAYARAGIEYDELHFSADKTCVWSDIMVEDRIENYDRVVANGTLCYLINRPWNQVEGGDMRNRIDNITEFADEVERITKQGFADLSLV